MVWNSVHPKEADQSTSMKAIPQFETGTRIAGEISQCPFIVDLFGTDFDLYVG